MTARGVVAIVDYVVRIYGDCGHVIEQTTGGHEALKPRETLDIKFKGGLSSCDTCTPSEGDADA